MKKTHQWTKAEVKKVAQIWDKKSADEIASELGVKTIQVNYIVMQMRKAGFNLPRKHRKGTLQVLLKEALAETR